MKSDKKTWLGVLSRLTVIAAAVGPGVAAADPFAFTAGNLVLSVYGAGATGSSPTYLDNGASPITLQQLSLSGVSNGVIASNAVATQSGQLVLPQQSSVANGYTQNAISGEYGSASEGILQRSSDGRFLTIAGYGVNAASFNGAASSFGGTTKSCIGQGTCFPLAQTPSSTVPRVVALIGAQGTVDTSTSLGSVAYSGNNPRSVATIDGSSFYISGQGNGGANSAGQGLYYAPLHATTATAIDNSFDTRVVEITNGNKLYLGADTTEGSGVHENISVYNGLPTTTATTPTILNNIKSKFTVSGPSQLNTVDKSIAAGTKIYLSPEQYFFASSTVLYVADSGSPKGDNNGASGATQGLSDGGLQKWVFDGTTWNLLYTISAGLGLVADTTSCGANQIGCGTTGLIGLTGLVVNGTTELFATNSTLGDLDPTFLFGVSDLLSANTLATGESFVQLYAAGPDQVIRGVAFAPVPEPASGALIVIGAAGALVLRRRRKRG